MHGLYGASSLPCVAVDLVFHDSVWKTPTQAVLDGADPSSVGIEAEKEFPVSDGIQHRAVEAVDEQEEMGSLSIQVSRQDCVTSMLLITATSKWHMSGLKNNEWWGTFQEGPISGALGAPHTVEANTPPAISCHMVDMQLQ